MGLLNLFKNVDINEGIKQYQTDKNAVLLDVRSKQEYLEGHIEGSINIPVGEIENAKKFLKDIDQSIYVYCRSGARASSATAALKDMGYMNVKNIGGIMNYQGKIVSK